MKYFELALISKACDKLTEIDDMIPIKTGLAIVKNVQLVQEALKPYWTLYNNAVKKYSNGTGNLNFGDSGYEECYAYLQELQNQEIDVNFAKIKMSDIEDIKLPLSLIQALSFMIEED